MVSTKLRLWATFFLVISTFSACKKLDNKAQRSDPAAATEVPEAGSQRPLFSGFSAGSGTEEPSGISSHGLECAWQQSPTSSASSAKLSCQVVDAQGNAIKGVSGIQWQLEGISELVKVTRSEHDAQIYLTLVGPTRDAVYAAIFDLQLTFRASNPVSLEVKGSGRELIKAPAGSQKVAASCEDFFDLMLIDEYGMATFSQMSRFECCENLSSALMNRVFPDPAARALPTKASVISATCTGPNLRIMGKGLERDLEHVLISPGICGDLAAYINAKGQ